jgi:apolipoprotein D and lipocalin family protein
MTGPDAETWLSRGLAARAPATTLMNSLLDVIPFPPYFAYPLFDYHGGQAASLHLVAVVSFMLRKAFARSKPVPEWLAKPAQCRISWMDTLPTESVKADRRWPLPRQVIVLCLVLCLAACTGMPEGVRPVADFELDRYLGKWYEIARLDHSFERGLTRVTAEYSLRDDGGVRVINRGFSADKGDWDEAEGKAYFVESPDLGYLKVSFFGPFYGSYVVFELDKDAYQYAFISGPDTSYLWLLARTPTVSNQILQRFITLAGERGFDTDALILVAQE